MSLKIYNTKTRKKEVFKPIVEGRVKMYVCGPTVYDLLHVGNFRGLIFFNVVRNWLERNGLTVEYVYNYTDVDDKIIHRAKQEGVTPLEISKKYITEFEKDLCSLQLKPHTRNPRVTEHIDDIIQFIEDLVQKGKAYELNGDVYYDVEKFSEYGKLSNKNLKELESGLRIEVNEQKKHPSDFALWKSIREGGPGACWPSPWGEGRPGWHIECSAMILSHLGEVIDIHGGGLDLVFPHHENEVAQSEGRTGKDCVNYWMHNNMVEFGHQKMSKSLGNIRTGRSFLEEYDGEILKYLMLMAHYRSPIHFDDTQVERAISSLAKFYSALALAKRQIASKWELVPVDPLFQQAIDRACQGFTEALNDDFNTVEALARLFEVLRDYNSRCQGSLTPQKKAISEVFYHWLPYQAEVLSLFQCPPEDYLKKLDDRLLKKRGLSRQQVDQLVRDRTKARQNKNYTQSDSIRDQLEQWGISVMDSKEGSFWEVDKSN